MCRPQPCGATPPRAASSRWAGVRMFHTRFMSRRRWTCSSVLATVLQLSRLVDDLCREIRAFSAVPIIMLAARVEEIDRLLGLELGADVYICKPFSPREVVARVKAVLRRSAGGAGAAPLSGLLLDDSCYTATLDGHDLGLTAVEFNLLRILAAHPGRIFTRDQLMARISPDERIVSDRTIRQPHQKAAPQARTRRPEM